MQAPVPQSLTRPVDTLTVLTNSPFILLSSSCVMLTDGNWHLGTRHRSRSQNACAGTQLNATRLTTVGAGAGSAAKLGRSRCLPSATPSYSMRHASQLNRLLSYSYTASTRHGEVPARRIYASKATRCSSVGQGECLELSQTDRQTAQLNMEVPTSRGGGPRGHQGWDGVWGARPRAAGRPPEEKQGCVAGAKSVKEGCVGGGHRREGGTRWGGTGQEGQKQGHTGALPGSAGLALRSRGTQGEGCGAYSGVGGPWGAKDRA